MKTEHIMPPDNGWLKNCVKHMKPVQKEIKWTKEACMIDAKKYIKPSDWQKNSTGHQAAWKYGWLKECTAHMNKQYKWTLELCIESALKYPTRTNWWQNERSAYSTAVARGWLQECCQHMKRKSKFDKPFMVVSIPVLSCT